MMDRDEAAAGRIRRFREVALPCLDDAYTFAYSLTRNQVEAEAAVQECFQRALDRFDAWRGPAIKPWLFGILRTICRADGASHAERRFRPPPHQRLGSRGAIPENEANERSVSRLVEMLPPLLREIIVLREQHGMSYRDIAEVTGMATGDVMAHLAKARAALAAEWRAGHRGGREQGDPIRQRKCTVF